MTTKLLSVADYAAQHVKKDGTKGVSTEYVYNLILKGKLKAVKFGKVTLVEMEDKK